MARQATGGRSAAFLQHCGLFQHLARDAPALVIVRHTQGNQGCGQDRGIGVRLLAHQMDRLPRVRLSVAIIVVGHLC